MKSVSFLSLFAILPFFGILSQNTTSVSGEVIRGIMFRDGETPFQENGDFNLPTDFPLHQIRIYHENDFLVPNGFKDGEKVTGTDEHYTGGFHAEIITREVKLKTPIPLFIKFRETDKGLGKITNYQTFGGGLTLFTPVDLKSTSIIRTDRPYGSYMFFSFGKSSHLRLPRLLRGQASFVDGNKGKFHHLTTTWRLGLIGTQFPGRFQHWIHEYVIPNSDLPQGWKHQISQMPSLNLSLDYEGLLCAAKNRIWTNKRDRFNTYNWAYLSFLSEADIGNYQTNYAVGLSFYLFNVNDRTPFYNPNEHYVGTYAFETHTELETAIFKGKIHHEYLGVKRLEAKGAYRAKRKVATENTEGLRKSESGAWVPEDNTGLRWRKRKRLNRKARKINTHAREEKVYEASVFPDSLHNESDTVFYEFYEKQCEELEARSEAVDFELENKILPYRRGGDFRADSMYLKQELEDHYLADGVRYYPRRVYIKYAQGYSFNLFLRVKPTTVVYNTMLQGNLFFDKSPHTFSYKTVNPFIMDLEGGINLTLFRGFSTRYSIAFRTREFKYDKDFHVWGAVGFFVNPVAITQHFQARKAFRRTYR